MNVSDDVSRCCGGGRERDCRARCANAEGGATGDASGDNTKGSSASDAKHAMRIMGTTYELSAWYEPWRRVVVMELMIVVWVWMVVVAVGVLSG